MEKLQESQCRECNAQILPKDDKNLQTIRGLNLLIHSESYYILEVKCEFCGFDNFLYRKGSLDKKSKNEIMKKIKR